MKKRAALAFLVFYTAFLQAQQQVQSFPDLYHHFSQKYFTPGSDVFSGLIKGLYETAQYTNLETASFKAQAKQKFGKEGGDLYRMITDSIFGYMKDHLLPEHFEKEFNVFQEPLALLNKEYCSMLENSGTAPAQQILKQAGESISTVMQRLDFRMAYEKAKNAPNNNGTPLADIAANAYLFLHCPEHTRLLKEVIHELMMHNQEKPLNMLMYEKATKLLEYWRKKDKHISRVEAIFPGYMQFIPVLNKVAQQDNIQSVTNNFDVETDSLDKPHTIFFTYYKGKGQKMILLNRVVFTFHSSSEHAQLKSLRIIPFEQIPGGMALLKKARWESDPKNIKPPPPPPPFPNELLKKN